MNIEEIKRHSIPFLIVYVLFDIVIVGSFLVTNYHIPADVDFIERTNQFYSKFVSYLINPFAVIGDIFTKSGLLSKFMTASFYTLIVFIILYIYWRVKNAKKYEYQGQEHGSSDWSKNGEEFRKLPDGSEILNKKDGFILSKNHFLGTDLKKVKVNKNILVFGGSGTGKSACYVKPNILQRLGSYVITDPKGELYRETSQFLKESGWNVKVLNLVDPDYSDRYNPLSHIRDHADVDIIAHTIVMSGDGEGGGKSSDPFWDNTAKMLLKACIYYVISVLPDEEQNLSSCLNIVRAGGSDETVFDKLFGELKPEHPGRKEYEGIRVGADKTKQSIAISLVSKLTHFDTPNMQKLTTSNNIEFEELGNKKTAIYVISPDSHSTYNYILTIFYGQLLQRLYAQADRNGGRLNQSVYLLLDEFANIGKIPDFNQKLSTSRSRGLSISIIVQSIDQLVDLYKDLHENIIANCDTQLFLGSKSIKTCEYVSKSLGQKTIKFQNKSVSKDKKEIQKQGVSFSEQRQGRDLMTVDELMRMGYDDEIILVRGLKPIKTKKAWYFKYHPQRIIAKSYEIRDLSEMPKPEEIEIHVMDVLAHIEEREKHAKQKLKEEKEQNSSILSSSSEEEIIDLVKEENGDFDLQKELERKFDELFGSNNNHD
ncbi:MAG: type IV secretory system conjugative DNA transfer family protein [Clostridia bacterium]|nr:type IV secretory system conjugative DNA transfer family protein [Clostridia bacterium]